MDGKIQFHQKNPYLRFDLSNSFFLLSVSLSVGIVYEYEQNIKCEKCSFCTIMPKNDSNLCTPRLDFSIF